METFHRPDSFQSHLKYFWNINKFRFIFPSVCIPLGPVDRDGAKKCFIRHGASSNRPVDALHRGSTEAPPRLHRGAIRWQTEEAQEEQDTGGGIIDRRRDNVATPGLHGGGGRWGREGGGDQAAATQNNNDNIYMDH